MMEVLFISNNLGRGGKERQIHEMLSYFSASEFPVRITLLLREPIVTYNVSKFKNIVTVIPDKRLSGFDFMKFCYLQCTKNPPQVVHVWESGCAFLFSLLRMFFLRNIKLVDGSLRYSKSFPMKSKRYWVARIARMLSDKVIANSKAGLLSINYAKSDKYCVISNGINLSRFSSIPVTQANRVITIGMLASFSRPKDFKTLIDAAIIILKSGKSINIKLVGDGPEKNSIMNSIPELLKPHFEFTGERENPELEVASFDIAVLLSKKGHSEGMSNSIMEYMALAKPIICSNTGGNAELVVNQHNGFLIERENLIELTDKINILLADLSLRQKMGAASRSIIEKDFDIKKVCEKYFNLYKSLI